jgi:hypothetical protein
MGIEVVVEDERGSRIDSMEDSTNTLHRLLPSHDDTNFRLLNCVDWYGDTTFNRHQLHGVRQELKMLASMERNSEFLDTIKRLDSLAERAQSEPHVYLKFYGD